MLRILCLPLSHLIPALRGQCQNPRILPEFRILPKEKLPNPEPRGPFLLMSRIRTRRGGGLHEVQGRLRKRITHPTCSEERRQLEPELAFWSKFASAKAAPRSGEVQGMKRLLCEGVQRFRMRVKTPHQTLHVSLSLNTIESLFDLVKYRFWSGEAIPGVRRPVTIRVRTAYSIAAT